MINGKLHRHYGKYENAFGSYAGTGFWGGNAYWVYSPDGKLLGLFLGR